MSCYLKRIRSMLEEMGVEVTKDNRKEIDLTIRSIVGTEDSNCPEIWGAVKRALEEDEESFISRLKEEANSRGW